MNRNSALLLAAGEALRARKRRLGRLRRRIALTVLGGGILLLCAAFPPRPRLVWNVSSSAPVGLYRVSPDAPLEPGDMVVARVPADFRRLAAERRYLPMNVPLVKRVAAGPGDDVCAFGSVVLVNDRVVARRRSADGAGRALPAWSGCRRLRGRQLFLLMDSAASFDGRYFGVTDAADIIGKARLLWRR
ncbi:MAG: S26 family signal peptidase [Novosphingobium sp.]|nr:S26 family signal peptidase [Novosphingobium sp.]